MVSDLLLRYGWSDAVASLLHPDERPARVLRVDRGECDVVTADGETRARTGRLAPRTGDWVTLQNTGIERILPRRGAIRRSSASGRSDEQMLAANVDTVAITTALDGDCVHRDLGRIERMLALAWESGAQPVVVLTKCDAVPAADTADATLARVGAIAPGAGVLAVSAATGVGLTDLTSWLRGTVVLIGPSGAGKSTLVNALLGEDRLATGAVRADHKGRHTTVRRELIPLSHPPSLRSPHPAGGQIIDTPGLRAVGLWEVADGIDLAFADITDLAVGCRFDDCAHEGEPGCAVDAAVTEGQVDPRRLASYRKLTRENAWIRAQADARLRSERNRAARAQSRAQRALYRVHRR